MPCSRSARSPSVSRARSPPAASTSSAISDLASLSRRPISVDLPSSTEPAVARRRRSAISGLPSEVALALAVLHRRDGHAVVAARLPALGDARGGDLLDDRLDGRGRGPHGAGHREVAHGPVAHG